MHSNTTNTLSQYQLKPVGSDGLKWYYFTVTEIYRKLQRITICTSNCEITPNIIIIDAAWKILTGDCNLLKSVMDARKQTVPVDEKTQLSLNMDIEVMTEASRMAIELLTPMMFNCLDPNLIHKLVNIEAFTDSMHINLAFGYR